MSLAVHNLSVQRGAKQVLRAMSCTLRAGEVTAICGPNAAGKSSLLMTLCGLLEPASGAVMLDGAPLSSLPRRARARAMGYLPQEGEIAWDVAVENLAALGRLAHRDADGERGRAAIDQALTRLDLDTVRARPLSQLSGGERARAFLARVLAGEPQWICADEPLAALDLAHQLRLLKLFQAQAACGTGVVLVLHDLAAAMNYADRVVVLDAGQIIADGLPQEALCETVLAKVWNVEGQWIGDPHARALVLRNGNN